VVSDRRTDRQTDRMNTSQIQKALAGDQVTGPDFAGVFACDQLQGKKITKFPCCLVANTDPQSERGSHWVCYYFDKNGNAEYFDSYGVKPLNCDLMKFFSKNGQNHDYNSQQMQGDNSTVCGQYCIAFLTNRARGVSMKQFVQRFKGRHLPGELDTVVGNLVNTVFDIPDKNNFTKITSFQNRQTGGTTSRIKQSQCCCSRSDKKKMKKSKVVKKRKNKNMGEIGNKRRKNK